MSLGRLHLALIGLLVVQVALIAVLNWPRSLGVSDAGSRPWLPRLEPDAAERIVIKGPGDERVELRRTGDGWVLPELDGYPARDDQIAELLENLERIEVRNPVVRNPRYHELLEVGEDGAQRHVRIWGEDDAEPMEEFYVGSAPKYRVHHVRRAGSDEVFEVDGIATSDLRAQGSAWGRLELLDVDEKAVARVTVRNASGAFTIEKGDAGWHVVAPAERADAELDEDEVERLVQKLAGLRAADPLGAAEEARYGFDEPAARVELAAATEDGETTHVVRVGTSDTEQTSRRYVTSSDLGFAAAAWDSSVERLLEVTLTDLTPSGSSE